MPNSRPQRQLVLVGGGHSHVQVLRRFAMEPPPDSRLTVVLDRPVAVYSGMVPGFVAGQYAAHELEIDVLPLARRARARVVLAPATGVDPERRQIHVGGRPPIPYDVAAFDVGSTVRGLELPGVREHALSTRPIGRFVRRVDDFVARARRAGGDRPLDVVIVGAGAGGVELAFTLERRLTAELGRAPRIRLLQGTGEILPGSPAAVIRRVRAAAARRGIEIECNRKVVAAGAGRLELDSGGELPCDLLVWVTGATAHGILAASGLAVDRRGFALVRRTLQTRDWDDLFAVGDCATLEEFPDTPKAGVYAVRQGPFLAHNLAARLAGEPLREYRPQHDFLALLNLGDGTALGTKWGRVAEGRWVMRLKDWIDRRFMRRFQVLAPEGGLSEEFARLDAGMDGGGEMTEMLCGGCAAKLGQTSLARALERIGPGPADATVRLGLARPDDAAAWTAPGGDTVLASLDVFRAFTDDPYQVGRVAAANAVSDLYAKGVAPRYAQALVALPERRADEENEEILVEVLAGIRALLDEIGVTLVGGHTFTNPELLVGLHVEAPAAGGDEILSLDRLAVGQHLVLTKPLGTGVLFHADMKGLARGPWIEEALARMSRPNRAAAEIARASGATAATDVTGFGLAGHLGEMVRASGVTARLALDALPALPGAVELLAAGERSTAHEQNARARRGMAIAPPAAEHRKLELLFDPQTSGGLLFGVPAEALADCLAALAAADERAAAIGRVLEARADGSPIEVVAVDG